MSSRTCPTCKQRQGIFVTGDTDRGKKYIIYVCPNAKCLDVWRIHIGDEKPSE